MKLIDWSSLQTRVTLGVLLAIMLTVWLVTLLASRVLRTEMEAAISAQQSSAVSLIAKNIDQSLKERIDAINGLAEHLSRARYPYSRQQNFLEASVVLLDMFNWGVLILDAQGVVRSSVPAYLNRVGMSYREMACIQSVLKEKKAMVTDPLIGKKAKQPLVSVIAPILDSQGNLQGVAIGVTNLSRPNFFDTVNTAKYGITGDFFIIAPKSRRYVASSDKRRVMTVGPPVGVNPLYDRYLEGYEGSGVAMSSRGVMELSSSKRIPSVDWVMASVLPAEEAFSPIINMQNSLLVGAMMFTILGVGVSWWWLRRQFQPVREALDLLTGMGDGSYPRQPLPVYRNDEIGQIANAFNVLLNRILAEEEKAVVHAANERLKRIVSHVPGVVFQYRLFPDGSACFPFASGAITDIYGVRPEDVKDCIDPIRTMTHPEDREMFFSTLQASAESLTLWRIHYRICLSGGVTKWLLIDAMPERDNGSVTWYGSISDISEAKAVEEELRIAATTFLTNDGIMITDANHVILRVNPAFTKITGYGSNELVGQTPDILGFDYPDGFFNQTVQERLSTQGEWQCEIINQHKSGDKFPCWLTINSVKDEQGRTTHYVNMLQDITERKKIEAEKTQLQAKLYQAQKMEAIGTLAGGIAHDFNNILSVIFGYSELVCQGAAPGSKLQKNMEKVLTAATKARELVNQILAFSRQTEVQRIPLKIQCVIHDGLKMLRSSIPSTIRIVEQIDPEIGLVLADPTQIYQILMNLCTNAYHAMEHTGGVLSISLNPRVIHNKDQKMVSHISPGEYVELTVTDTGPGIAPETIDKIFDPYFTTKESGKGTGMGLAIIHGILKEYGGTITVENHEGEGAAFHVYFPVVDKDIEPQKQADVKNIETGKERILLVDDDDLLLEMGRVLLDSLGYHVTAHTSSIRALTKFQKRPGNFDLVITDQTMPEMTGADIARRMIQVRPDIPILLCTGYSDTIDEETAKSIGIKEFAYKPISMERLSKLIRSALDKK
nr:ATP-binding protein [uncultured Desulfobacter sp.]